MGGVGQIPVETACRPPPLHPFSHSTEGAKCCEGQGIWPISQAQHGSLVGRQLVQQARALLLSIHLEWSAVKVGLSPVCWGVAPWPKATPHSWGSLLPCARDQPFHPCSACVVAQKGPHTLSPYGSQTEEGLQPVQTHALPEGTCHHPSASANEAGLGGPYGLAVLLHLPHKHLLGSGAGMGVFGLGSLDRNSRLDSAECNHTILAFPMPHSLRQKDDPFRVADKEFQKLIEGGKGMGLLRPDRDTHVKGEIPDWHLGALT